MDKQTAKAFLEDTKNCQNKKEQEITTPNDVLSFITDQVNNRPVLGSFDVSQINRSPVDSEVKITLMIDHTPSNAEILIKIVEKMGIINLQGAKSTSGTVAGSGQPLDRGKINRFLLGEIERMFRRNI